MLDALLTEAAHRLFDKFPEAVKEMTEVSGGKPAKLTFRPNGPYAQLHPPNILKCVPEERIFNVDESGLLYKQKPKYRLGMEALRG